VEQTGGMVEEDRLRGLINTVNYIKALIQHIAGDPNEKQRVKQYSDALSQIEALVKAFAQRLQEQKSQMQLDPETQSKIQTSQALAQSKIQLTQATTQQKMQQSDAKFRQKMQQGDLKTQASLGEQATRTQSDLQEQEIRTMADLQEQDMRAAMDARVKAAEMNKPKEP
jgi:hypothetical protein